MYAVEMFLDTRDQQLYVNEVSPRVHNSGHHTLDTEEASQFEQHVRAVCELPLRELPAESAAVMQNLIYTDDLASLMGQPPGRITTEDPLVHVHWYGKQEARPGRKMGHITCTDADKQAAKERIATVLKHISERSVGVEL